jgi:REP element-mobilizing transposase RayT
MTEHRGWTDRGKLPHFDSGGTIQTVTFRLADSLPESAFERARSEHREHAAFIAWLNDKLDNGMGGCALARPEAAECVQDALLHFHRVRYALHAWVVMPNHVHVLFEQRGGERLADIVHSWKSFTANRINKLLERSGQLWARDYFDRYIRDEAHYWAAVHYIEENPVNARLAPSRTGWQWSSAHG